MTHIQKLVSVANVVRWKHLNALRFSQERLTQQTQEAEGHV